MKNYSQNKEQDVILNYFEKVSHGPTPPRWVINGYPRPTFIDIGANDGITLSNTRALAELGSSGILVEPDPNAFERLEKLYKGYKGIYCYNYAICDSNSKRILQSSGELLRTGDVGLVSTFNASEMDRFKGVLSYEPHEVKCFTWKTALNRWRIKRFDFISIDCEGEDLIILKQIDLTHTHLLCIEHNSRPELKKEYLDYTSKFGMNRVIYESGENIIVCR